MNRANSPIPPIHQTLTPESPHGIFTSGSEAPPIPSKRPTFKAKPTKSLTTESMVSKLN